MASFDSFTTEQLKHEILDHGFCYQRDPVIGESVNEIKGKGFPFKTEEGLDFCKLNTFDDKDICAILESIFPWSGLGCYKALGVPHRAFSFLNNTQPEVPALIVQLWSKNSKVVFYKGSHLRKLNARPATIGYLEIPPTSLAIDAIKRTEVEMQEGGRAVIDARLGFTILQGLVINFGFATEVELREWATMKLPNLQKFKDRVMAMNRDKIGNNFELVTP
ncbi:hypothetical protein N7G274_010803 [Stereocaulon virgatum]|uniref:Uncharacterized protein n=1 Tax=Stereocaulon virgatum TaxID=373712 RepID=A0ABR3ZSW9_9LECA